MHEKGRGNGYVLTYGGKRFYFSGDTEGTPEMRALQNIDVAFVCMNLPYTMSPEAAAEAVRAFHPAIVYPYHYSKSDLSIFQKGLGRIGHRSPPTRLVSEIGSSSIYDLPWAVPAAKRFRITGHRSLIRFLSGESTQLRDCPGLLR